MVSVHPSLLRSCAWNPEITDCCNAQVKVESCLYIDRLSYCFIWSNGRSNFVTCTVCVTTSVDDILPRYYLCRTLLCSSDRDHKTQRSAVTKARTDDATVQHVVFYWRCFKKKNTPRKRRCLSLLNASCLDSALHTSHPSLFLSHLMWEDETTRLDSCLLCFPFYFATPRIPDCSDFLPWLRNSSGVFDYPASPFSTYTPSCSLPLCQIVFIHMADFFFCIPPLPANHLPRLHRWQTLLSELRATKLTLAVQSWMRSAILALESVFESWPSLLNLATMD